MIVQMTNLPANSVGVVASGKVTAQDYETVLIPAVEAALTKAEGVRMLYQVGPEFEGFELGAMWDDLKLGLSHFSRWEKIAVVTDEAYIANTVSILSVTLLCQLKVFRLNQLEQAKSWLEASAQ